MKFKVLFLLSLIILSSLAFADLLDTFNAFSDWLTSVANPGQVTGQATGDPPIVIVTHSPSSPTTRDTVTITANARDAGGVGLRSIQIFVDDLTKPQKTCTTSSCSFSSIFSAGDHSYYAVVTDTAAKQGRDPASGTKRFSVSFATLTTTTTLPCSTT